LEQAKQAAAALAEAARIGNKEGIDRARSLFETAQATGEEARSVAQSAGDRRGALFAARQLKEITDQQLTAERSLAATTAARIPTLEQEKQKQQQKLDLITQATRELIKNSTLFNEQGEQLPADQLQRQAEARRRALASLADQGVGASTIADLSFRTEGSLQKLGADLQSTLAKINGEISLQGTVDASARIAANFQSTEATIRGTVGASAQIASNYERAAAAAAQLGVPAYVEPPTGNGPPAPHAFGGLIQAFADGGFVLPSYFNDGGSAAAKGTDTVPAMLAPREFVVNQAGTARFFSQLQAINAGVAPQTARSQSGDTYQIGDININESGSPRATAREVSNAIYRQQRRGAGRSLK
jgi:hypothetical protein